jgi:two-component system sensor histidine kinase EvgS
VKLIDKGLFASARLCVLYAFALALLVAGRTGFAADAVPGARAPSAVRLQAPRKTLTVGMIAGGWAPFDQLVDGKPAGLSIDYLRLLLADDVSVDAKAFPDMPALVQAACAGAVDIVSSISRTPERERCLSFSAPYFRAPTAVVTRKTDAAMLDRTRLPAARIAIERGYALERSLHTRFPRARIEPFVDTPSAMRAVANGEADVYFGLTPSVQHVLAAGEFSGLGIAFEEAGPSGELRFAVPHDRVALRNRIDAALAKLRPADERAIRARWLDAASDGRSPGLPSGLALSDRALRAMPPAEKARIHQTWQRESSHRHSGNVTSLRLLPLLIGIGVALLVTLRAYALLQREVRRRERTERQLASQLNFQQTMMEMIPYPLIAKDHGNRYIAVNRAFEATLGVQREDLIGRTGAEAQAWGAPHSEALDRLTRETLRMGSLRTIELEFTNRAGDLRHGLFWVGACAGVDGNAPGVIATMVDVTEIRRAEVRARETERRLFDVTRSLPAVVFQLRRDTNGVYSLPYVGGDTLHLLGGDDAALLKDGAFERVCDEDRPRVLAELERSALSGERILTEFRSSGEGLARWVRAEFVPRRESDGNVVWSGYWADASVERARADELARARDLAEAASKAKDDFLAMMSHEIRTPMNGVLGLVEVLESTRLNVDQQQMLGMIHDSAGALLQILDDLLDYSKIEAGHLTIEAEPIDMRELVDNAVGLLAGRAHEKGLKMRVDVEPEVAATLLGDSVRLRQILFNLLSNAIKFTVTGEVSVHVAVAARTAEGQRIEIAVEDTGIGIARDVQARLFEPFVQAESSTTRRFGGTGLGLTICRKLIDLMDGKLELHSMPGAGTKMLLRLVMPVEQQSYAAGRLRGKRGIVAIDDLRIARALVHFGEAVGIELRRVSPGSTELADPAKLADADFVFLPDGVNLERLARGKTCVIHVTEKAKATGYRVLGNEIRVSINPISWRGLGAAFAAASTGAAQAASPDASGCDEVRAALPDRERAIANGRLVLVAEDHPVNQELIRHQLRLLGFACDVVDDGAEALAALDRRPYGCLITDCHMPTLTGYELAQQIRNREAGPGNASRLPILGITASTAPEDLRLCREAGMDDCLVKPTRLATLREHLNRWFGVDAERQPACAETETEAEVETEPLPLPPSSGNDMLFGPADVERLKRQWGSESKVKALLDSFGSTLRGDLQVLLPLLDSADLPKLRNWQHRVAGAAGVLRYRPLLDALETYRSEMAANSSDEIRVSGAAFIVRCRALLERIEAQAALLSPARDRAK